MAEEPICPGSKGSSNSLRWLSSRISLENLEALCAMPESSSPSLTLTVKPSPAAAAGSSERAAAAAIITHMIFFTVLFMALSPVSCASIIK